MDKALETSKQVFTYKSLGFTKYVERYSNHVALKIVSNKDSEVVFEKNYMDKYQAAFYTDVDIFEALDHYCKLHLEEIDQVYYMLKDWTISP
ncbi:hypothetical protein [Macrococcus brunensis]|uniref:hypothetical protein n=1 Tax=Macrococcus brunensis TaxID=198483 RepID=UPI001EF1594F|nr:hypothetical protein [Macrococcus brunensis]ULG73187.1 hypothetical protein MGG13_05535 [Macrococcus brunensis]